MKRKCNQVWNDKKSSLEIEEMIETIKKIFVRSNFHLLAALSIESSSHKIKLDEAILYSLLKAVKNSNELKNKKPDEKDEENFLVQQLDLALNWNRVDVAKKYILDNDLLKANLIKNAMYKAINKDRPEFVQEFIDFGLKARRFLTYRFLLKLYNDIPDDSAFFETFSRIKLNRYSSWLPWKRKIFEYDEIFIKLKDVGLIIKDLFDNFYRNEYLKYPYDKVKILDTRRIIEQTNEFGQVEFK